MTEPKLKWEQVSLHEWRAHLYRILYLVITETIVYEKHEKKYVWTIVVNHFPKEVAVSVGLKYNLKEAQLAAEEAARALAKNILKELGE